MKKVLSILLAVSMIMTFSSFGAVAEGTEDTRVTGSYDTFYWDYNKETKVLLISGYGTIPSYKTEGLGYTEFAKEIEEIDMMSITGNSTFEIGDYAFYQFRNLKKIHLASNVTRIGYKAFERCSSLESFEMPDSVTEIGMDVFAFCSNLTNLKLSNGLTSIPDGIIWSCRSLETLDIPESVKTLEEGSLGYCYLKTITIPETITEIPSNAFANNSSLTEVYLPKTLKRITKEAFSGCSNLKTVYYDGTLEQWEEDVEIFETENGWYRTDMCFDKADFYYDFEGSFPIEESEVVQSGSYGIINWTLTANGLLTISGEGAMPDFPNGGSAPWVKYRNDIKGIVVEEGITRIGNNAFFSEGNLKKIVIPNSVTAIGTGAIYGNHSLRIVWIGSGVKEIESLAFSESENIKSIIFRGTKSSWDSINIEGDYNGILKTADVFCMGSEDKAVIPGEPQEEIIKDDFAVKSKAYRHHAVYSWTKIDGAKKYIVYQAKGNSKHFKKVAFAKKALKCKVSKLKPNREYKVYVVAYDKYGKKLSETEIITVKTKK